MKCAKARSLMLDHLYGDLRPSSERALLRHLQECSTCSEEFEAHKATVAAFAKLDMEEPPPGLSSRLVAMAEQEVQQPEPARAIFGGWNWKPVFASVAMAALAIFIVVRYVPTAPRSESQYLALDSESKAAQKAPVPMEAQKPAESVPESEISATSEGKSSGTHRRDAAEVQKKAKYEMDSEGFGDDTAANEIVSLEAPAVRGQVGGMAGADETPDAGRRAQAPQLEAPRPKGELPAPGYGDSSATSSGTLDSKDFYRSSRAGEEEVRSPVDGPPTALPAMPLYAAVNDKPAAEKAEPPAAGEPQPRSMPSKAAELKEEAPLVVGGSVIAADSLQLDQDAAREEQMRDQGAFDSREFNEAVMESEKAPGRKLDKQLSADYMYNLARTYQRENECEKALAIYETIPREHPDYGNMAKVYIAMAECYLKSKRYEQAKHSFELARDHKETGPIIERDVIIDRVLSYEYAYYNAQNRLKEDGCNEVRTLFNSIPEDSSKTFESASFEVKRSILADVYFSLSECYVETGRFEEALDTLRLIQSLFPEKREDAIQKMFDITDMQEAAQKANEQPPDTAAEPPIEKAE